MEKKNCFSVFLLVFFLSCSSGSDGSSNEVMTVRVGSGSSEIILSWEPPVSNADGSVMRDFAGFNLYHSSSLESVFASQLFLYWSVKSGKDCWFR